MRHVLFAAFTALVIAGCAGPDEPDLDTDTAALTAAQCSFFDVNGKVQICHRTGSSSHPYTIIRVAEQACINGHAGHAGDYVTSTDPSSPLYDPTCNGQGCLPETAPCDATVPCCDGLTCQAGTCVNVDECESQPCQHGECVDGENSYTCICQPGYTGTNCEIDIDECATGPCQHGLCVDLVNDYVCVCDPGYTGGNCELDIDECASGDPCNTQPFGFGSCDNTDGGFTCTCGPFASGEHCEITCPCILDAVLANDIATALPWAYGGIGIAPGTACTDDGAGTTVVDLETGLPLDGNFRPTPGVWLRLTPTSCMADLEFSNYPVVLTQYAVTTPGQQAICRAMLDAAISNGGLTCGAPTCDSFTCDNGGTCHEYGAEVAYCECPAGFSGQHCELP